MGTFQKSKFPDAIQGPTVERQLDLSQNSSFSRPAVLTRSCTLTKCKNRKKVEKGQRPCLLIIIPSSPPSACIEFDTWWVSNNGSLSCADPHCYPARVCLPPVEPLCLKSACKVSGLTQNLQIMINYDSLAQTSQCSFVTPTLNSQWLFTLNRLSFETLRPICVFSGNIGSFVPLPQTHYLRLTFTLVNFD